MKKILVIGDALIDTNIAGECDRLSPEGPWPIVKAIGEKSTLGGAANVAAHVSSAGIKCIFAFKTSKYEPIGSNSFDVFEELLAKYKIDPIDLPTDGSFPISTKKRVMAGNHQICRIDYENTVQPNKETEFEWYCTIGNIIKNNDIGIVLFSDYNKGTLTDDLIQMITNLTHTEKITSILDPKRPSFVNLKRLDIIKPNGKEIPATNLTADEVSWKLNKTALVNTIGEKGVRILKEGSQLCSMPSVATNVVDVCGAGDSFHSILGIALFNGLNLKEAVAAGNMASSFAIANRGTYVLTQKEIDECIAFGRKFSWNV